MLAPESERPLYDALTALAGSPDDISGIDEMLVRIASLAVSLVTPVDYASITAQREGAPTTVALSNQIALAIDEAQYADQAGPCLDALDAGIPVSASIATTLVWPGFRQAAMKLGVRASLSIPLFAGRGHPIAALNLYARDSNAFASLSGALLSLFDSGDIEPPSVVDEAHLLLPLEDAGSSELLAGLTEAFAVQHRIHIAVGVLMQQHDINADQAYATLRGQAAANVSGLLDAAAAVVADLARD
jgi:hypothetical protein